MDGLPHLVSDLAAMSYRADRQRTLKSPITCVGVGLHSGQRVQVLLRPAPMNSGVVFRRADLGLDVPARFDHVTDARLCTTLALSGQPEASVGTVEHLVAALAACGVDNVLVELDGPEVPVLDGSAAPWLFLLDCAGLISLNAPRRFIEVLRTVRVEEGDAFAELRPSFSGLDMAMLIDFDAPAIGRQALTFHLTEAGFRHELARARTFTQAHEIAGLQKLGLARGGSLDNAVVVDGARVLNPAGLRMADEFVRHKMLDAVGDLSLCGAALQGRFVGHRSGHSLNNRLLRALFADAANWRETGATARPDRASTPLDMVAAAA